MMHPDQFDAIMMAVIAGGAAIVGDMTIHMALKLWSAQ